MAATYTIKIKTSDAFRDSGTDSTVYIQLHNSRSDVTSHWAKLDVSWHNDFKRGATDIYTVKMLDLGGMPDVARLKLKGIMGVKDKWLCEYIEVIRGDESVMFPINSYITDEFEAKAEVAGQQQQSQ